jgi:hypothetical protein
VGQNPGQTIDVKVFLNLRNRQEIAAISKEQFGRLVKFAARVSQLTHPIALSFVLRFF